jgi:leucyl-tRNA synthetase
MFGWRWEQGGPWDSQGIEGSARWLNRVWSLVLEPPRDTDAPGKEKARELQRAVHFAIKHVTRDMENFSFNTAIARMMELTNALNRAKPAYWGEDLWDEGVTALLLLLAPVAPHMAEELWSRLDKPYSIHEQDWPEWDEAMLEERTVEIPIQINGKIRGRVTLPADAGEEEIREAALAEENVQRHLEGLEIVKIIIPRGQIVSIVAK